MSSSRMEAMKKSETVKGFEHGVITGICANTLTYGLDRFTFLFHVSDTTAEFKGSFKKAPLGGLGTNILQGAMKYGINFGSRPFITEQFQQLIPEFQYNKSFGDAAGAGLAIYGTSFLSVFKALRFYGRSIEEARSLPPSQYFRGVHATALRDAIFFSVYTPLHRSIHDNFKIPDLIAGGVAGFAATFPSNPAALVANRQKASGLSIGKIVKEMYQQEGMKGFTRGFFVSASRGMFLGVAIAAGEEVADVVIPLMKK